MHFLSFAEIKYFMELHESMGQEIGSKKMEVKIRDGKLEVKTSEEGKETNGRGKG